MYEKKEMGNVRQQVVRSPDRIPRLASVMLHSKASLCSAGWATRDHSHSEKDICSRDNGGQSVTLGILAICSPMGQDHSTPPDMTSLH